MIPRCGIHGCEKRRYKDRARWSKRLGADVVRQDFRCLECQREKQRARKGTVNRARCGGCGEIGHYVVTCPRQGATP